jgi:voltage-gated potassium channel
MDIKKKVYDILEFTPDAGKIGLIVNVFLIFLIISTVLMVILETKIEIYLAYRTFFNAFEVFSIAVFTIEYILRVWCATINPRYHRPVVGRLRYMGTFFAIIDFISFAPFYIPFIIPVDLRFLRILRLFRIFRILKLGRYSQSFTVMKNVFTKKKEDIVIAFFILVMILVIASSLMYYAENQAQPDKFSSIPDTMWWTIVTISTIGYGDVYPITPLGKVLGSIVAIIGIGFFALPAGIIASGYIEEVQARQAVPPQTAPVSHENSTEGFTCIHCGGYNPLEKNSGKDDDQK